MLHPIDPRILELANPSGARDEGRGLRTLLDGLHHHLRIVTSHTSYFEDHLAGYSCTYFIPPSRGFESQAALN